MFIKDIISEIEKLAPLAYQESYDNSGLIIGDTDQKVSSILLCFDVTENVVDEAIELGSNLILSHHPAVFSGLKRITGKSATERVVLKAIKNDIALYSAHTNLDSVFGGISSRLSDKLGLINQQVLIPRKGELVKLVTFAPINYAQILRNSLFDAGAGYIGNYDSCSYNVDGYGTFKAGETTNPFVGERGDVHTEPEVRIEVIVKRHILNRVIKSLLKVHPYEEVAYDVYSLENELPNVGLGMIGDLPEPMLVMEFLDKLKYTFSIKSLRYSKINKKYISRVAVCGGSGGAFITNAIKAKADIYITGDCKYHQFIDVIDNIILADIGHYESEYFATEIFYEILNKKFPNFAVYLAKQSNNPVNYL